MKKTWIYRILFVTIILSSFAPLSQGGMEWQYQRLESYLPTWMELYLPTSWDSRQIKVRGEDYVTYWEGYWEIVAWCDALFNNYEFTSTYLYWTDTWEDVWRGFNGPVDGTSDSLGIADYYRYSCFVRGDSVTDFSQAICSQISYQKFQGYLLDIKLLEEPYTLMLARGLYLQVEDEDGDLVLNCYTGHTNTSQPGTWVFHHQFDELEGWLDNMGNGGMFTRYINTPFTLDYMVGYQKYGPQCDIACEGDAYALAQYSGIVYRMNLHN